MSRPVMKRSGGVRRRASFKVVGFGDGDGEGGVAGEWRGR